MPVWCPVWVRVGVCVVPLGRLCGSQFLLVWFVRSVCVARRGGFGAPSLVLFDVRGIVILRVN